VGHY